MTTLKQATQVPVGNYVYYDPVKVIVNDWWVVAGSRNIELRDIRAARIVNIRYTINWRKRLLEQARFLLITSTILALGSFIFFQELRWGFFWLIGFLQVGEELWKLRKRSVEHKLMLSTSSGQVEIAQSNDEWYVQNIAREIGRRLAKVADDAIVNAVAEPARSTLLIAAEPPTPNKPIVYNSAGVTVEPDKVTIRDRVFPVDDILRAEVRREIRPMNILPWVGAGAWLALYSAAIFVPLLWLLVIPMLLFELFRLGLFGMLHRALQEWRRTHKYTVVMETRYEDIELAPTSNVLYPGGMVGNINRIVKQHMLVTATTPPQLVTGVPTKQL
jgi:hypothetical protein